MPSRFFDVALCLVRPGFESAHSVRTDDVRCGNWDSALGQIQSQRGRNQDQQTERQTITDPAVELHVDHVRLSGASTPSYGSGASTRTNPSAGATEAEPVAIVCALASGAIRSSPPSHFGRSAALTS